VQTHKSSCLSKHLSLNCVLHQSQRDLLTLLQGVPHADRLLSADLKIVLTMQSAMGMPGIPIHPQQSSSYRGVTCSWALCSLSGTPYETSHVTCRPASCCFMAAPWRPSGGLRAPLLASPTCCSPRMAANFWPPLLTAVCSHMLSATVGEYHLAVSALGPQVSNLIL